MVTHYDMLTGEVIEQTPEPRPASVDPRPPGRAPRLMTLDEAVAIEAAGLDTAERDISPILAAELLAKGI